uniref:Uncharacterized protein n=1 Tax=Arion vulgaris TaxID=1028688 RepID=A0A0B7C550_9EUPU
MTNSALERPQGVNITAKTIPVLHSDNKLKKTFPPNQSKVEIYFPHSKFIYRYR